MDEFRKFLYQEGIFILAEYGMETHFAFRISYEWFRKIIKLFPKLRHMDFLLDPTILGKRLGGMHLYVAVKKDTE